VVANLDAKSDKNRQGEATIYLAAETTQQQIQDYFLTIFKKKKTSNGMKASNVSKQNK